MTTNKMNENYIYWIMGPTSSGKTTLAIRLLDEFRKKDKLVIHFDGDEVRDFFGRNHGFSEENRLQVVSTLVHLANKSLDAGLNVIVSALTANQDARDYINYNVKNMVLIYIDCSIEKCADRDPKRLYKKANRGEINTLIGFNTRYKAPDNPDIVINTENKSIHETITELIFKIRSLGLP